MTPDLSLALLRLKSKRGAPFEVTVSGTSMLPVLYPGDRVLVQPQQDYTCGDILVFLYKHNELIIHRLLKIENHRYYCKGDNSFRLEDVAKERILGVAMIDSDDNRNSDFIEASYKMNRLFRKFGYNKEKTINTPEYIKYIRKYIAR